MVASKAALDSSPDLNADDGGQAEGPFFCKCYPLRTAAVSAQVLGAALG